MTDEDILMSNIYHRNTDRDNRFKIIIIANLDTTLQSGTKIDIKLGQMNACIFWCKENTSYAWNIKAYSDVNHAARIALIFSGDVDAVLFRITKPELCRE